MAAAVAVCLHDAAACGRIFELGGPESYTLREMPIPFVLAGPLAKLAEMLPQAPLSIAQVDLLRHDNLPSSGVGGVAEFVAPRNLRDTLAELRAHQEVRGGRRTQSDTEARPNANEARAPGLCIVPSRPMRPSRT